MIANCDQYLDVAIDDYLDAHGERGLDGLIMTMTAGRPEVVVRRGWTRGLVDQRGREGGRSPTEATVGIYNFAPGRGFRRAPPTR